MRYRASRTLVIHPQDGRFLVFNFLTKSVFAAGSAILSVLGAFQSWQDERGWTRLFPGKSRDSICRELNCLISLTALLAEDGPKAALEAQYLAQWEWALPTGLFHFSLQDITYKTSEAAVEAQKKRALFDPSPPLYMTHSEDADRIAMPAVGRTSLADVMCARRTQRTVAETPITCSQLAKCLFAGLGITGEITTETGQLPLSTTPSGGARNPFEAYVFARNIEGLAPGFYHYSAKQHSLRRLDGNLAPAPSTLLGGQVWADAMPCIIFLVAYLERIMWKYSDSNAYRVVLIEAGHIGQNIMLAATENGLSACPTAALNHSAIHQCLDLKRLTQSALYALTLSSPVG